MGGTMQYMIRVAGPPGFGVIKNVYWFFAIKKRAKPPPKYGGGSGRLVYIG
jgi:hypothetical protein